MPLHKPRPDMGRVVGDQRTSHSRTISAGGPRSSQISEDDGVRHHRTGSLFDPSASSQRVNVSSSNKPPPVPRLPPQRTSSLPPPNSTLTPSLKPAIEFASDYPSRIETPNPSHSGPEPSSNPNYPTMGRESFPQPQVSLPSSTSISSASSASSSGPPLTYPRPTIETLLTSSSSLDRLSDQAKLNWCQDVIRVLERPESNTHQPPSKHPQLLQDLLNIAVPIIISFTTHAVPSLAALASYLKGCLLASGQAADFLPKDPRRAFKEFETAARGGEIRGWFKLGRDYESVGDIPRAKDCFERGTKRGDGESIYRIAMAHLMGQLNFPPNPAVALPLLQKASDLATSDHPQPAYVYGMLLANELLLPTTIPSHLLLPSLPNGAAPQQGTPLFNQYLQARDHIEKAATLSHPPAQYKLGFMYEHATLTCPYDPLLSVQWYSLGSQGGEVEADMALSKWFLCGAEGSFVKNEELARNFAEKAARGGLSNGCFAMGYYFELGIGGRKDTDQARKWYQRAAKQNNQDAITRLAALSQPRPSTISQAQHELVINDTLIRRRSQAKIRSARNSIIRPSRFAPSKADRERQPGLSSVDEHGAWSGPQRSPGASGRAIDEVWRSPRPDISSPAPRIGEIMCPSPAYPYPQPTFPNPQTNQRAQASPGRIPKSAMPFSPNPDGMMSPRIPMTSNIPARMGYALQDPGGGPLSPIPDNTRRDDHLEHLTPAAGQRKKSGPQTFAEMGFVSKPVEDEGCTIM